MDPILQLIEGKIPKVESDQDMLLLCDRFGNGEKCIRNIAKECLAGIHKTATSTVATATRRFKNAECKTPQSRGKYMEPIKCVVQNGPRTSIAYRNLTGILQGVRDLNITPEEKLIKMCCVIQQLDLDLESIYGPSCPKSVPLILGIVHAITDDARSTLCVNPKCKGALNVVHNHKYEPPQNFVEPVAEILYQINTNE